MLVFGSVGSYQYLTTSAQIRHDNVIRLRDETHAGCIEVVRLPRKTVEKISNAIGAVEGSIADYPGRVHEDQRIAREQLKLHLVSLHTTELEEFVATFSDDATQTVSLMDPVRAGFILAGSV